MAGGAGGCRAGGYAGRRCHLGRFTVSEYGDTSFSIAGNVARELRLDRVGELDHCSLWVVSQRSTPRGRKPHFFEVHVFGEMAVHTAGSLVKGDRVLVSGHLESVPDRSSDRGAVTRLIAEEVAVSLRWADR